MVRGSKPRDNGWTLRGKCFSCGWIGPVTKVCPSCGHYYEHMSTVVVRWVRTTKWYHWFTEDWPRGYWEEKKDESV